MEQASIKVRGMSCQGCVKSVTQLLQKLPGVAEASVSLERGEAAVAYDPATVSLATLRQAIADAGFDTA